jgi:hypothetical protein
MVATARPGMALSEAKSARGRATLASGATTRLFEPSLLVRPRARATRRKLDRALAAGADPSASPLLAARAAQLADPRTGERVAAYLEQFASSADRPRSRVQTLPLRDAVQTNQKALLELARALRREQPAYARGIAMLHMVRSDGTGPAYTDPSGERLARKLELAAQGLSGHTPQIASP